MASIKFVTIALLAFMAISVSGKSNDLIVGSRVAGDRLIEFKTVRVPSKILQIVSAKQTFSGDRFSRFTEIRLLDQNKKGNGATAKILGGGPGSSFVIVDFKSQRGHSIDFLVEIYGM